jgi:predicted nicotinamide N-methyase
VFLDLGAGNGIGSVAETARVAESHAQSRRDIDAKRKDRIKSYSSGHTSTARHSQILLGVNIGPGPQWDKVGMS